MGYPNNWTEHPQTVSIMRMKGIWDRLDDFMPPLGWEWVVLEAGG